MPLFDENPYHGLRRVIDISGDGPNNNGAPVTGARDAALAKGGFDAITLIHNETSTGVRNPLKEIADVVKKYPDVLLIVDTVSSFSTEPITLD